MNCHFGGRKWAKKWGAKGFDVHEGLGPESQERGLRRSVVWCLLNPWSGQGIGRAFVGYKLVCERIVFRRRYEFEFQLSIVLNCSSR